MRNTTWTGTVSQDPRVRVWRILAPVFLPLESSGVRARLADPPAPLVLPGVRGRLPSEPVATIQALDDFFPFDLGFLGLGFAGAFLGFGFAGAFLGFGFGFGLSTSASNSGPIGAVSGRSASFQIESSSSSRASSRSSHSPSEVFLISVPISFSNLHRLPKRRSVWSMERRANTLIFSKSSAVSTGSGPSELIPSAQPG